MNDHSDLRPSARQDLVGGCLSIALGAFVLFTASNYPMGSLLRMGPGFFPGIIAVLIMLLGSALIVGGLRQRANGSRMAVQWRSMLAIGGGIVFFALSLERAGLVPATLGLVLLSSLAQRRWRPRSVAVLAIAVTVLVYLLFVTVLQIPVRAVSL